MSTTQNPLCPDCGVQLQAYDDSWSCPNCGFQTDDPSDPSAGRSLDSGDPDVGMLGGGGPDPDDDPIILEHNTGPSYDEILRQSRGKSFDELLEDAAARVKPPTPLPEQDELEDALGTAADVALAHAGSCPHCGADADQIEDGVCKACGEKQPSGVQAWVFASDDGERYAACSELCAKVGAAQVDGKALGKRLHATDEDEPKCYVCQEPLTAIGGST